MNQNLGPDTREETPVSRAASAGTEGWLFFAASALQRDEFVRACGCFDARIARARSYLDGGAFRRHLRSLEIIRERKAHSIDEVRIAWGQSSARKLARVIVEILDAAMPVGTLGRDILGRNCIRLAMTTFSVIRIVTAGTKSGARAGMSYRSLRGNPIDFGDVDPVQVRKMLALIAAKDGLRREKPAEAKILEMIYRRLLDQDLVMMVRYADLGIGPEDLEEEPDWVEQNGTADAAGNSDRELQEALVAFQAAEKAYEHAHRKAGNAITHLTSGGSERPNNAAKLPFWDWATLAYAETLIISASEKLGCEATLSWSAKLDVYLGSHWVWQAFFATAAVDTKTIEEGVTYLVERPRKIKRWRVDQDTNVGCFKERLMVLAESMVNGIEYTLQFRHLQREFRKAETTWQNKVWLLSQFLAFAATYHRKHPSGIRDLKEVATAAIANLGRIVGDARCEVNALRLETPDDAEFARLVSEEEAGVRAAHEEMQRWLAESMPIESSTGEEEAAYQEDAPPCSVDMFYVANLGSPEWREIPFRSKKETLNTDLNSFLRENGIETVVPSSSIAAAIRHFLEMPPERRRELKGEEIAGVWWRKIKRGRQRIYLLERNGRVFFHLLRRKDWEHAESLEARFLTH